MAITYKSQGAGASTETSSAALSPLCPATVDAGDILIAHVFWEGVTTAPATPSGWTLLSGPHVIESTIARHWVFGKIADGSEDGAAVAFGAPAVTTQRGARVYSFAGRVFGTITDLVTGFAATSHATDPQMPTVTTTINGALAVALVGQNDNNAQASPTGESGGDWVEAVAEYTAALTPGLALGIHTCTPTANPGTVSGGADNTQNDPVGVVGFQIKQFVAAVLVIQDATHAHTAESLTLTQHNVLAIANAAHAHTGENVTLTAHNILVIQDAAHAHTGENVSLTQHNLLVIQDAAHAQAAENLVLTAYEPATVLVIQDAAHVHAAENVPLTQHNLLAIQDAAHVHETENVVLTAYEPGGVVLVIQDALHAHIAENLALIQHNLLAIQSAQHAQVAENVVLTAHEPVGRIPIFMAQYRQRVQ